VVAFAARLEVVPFPIDFFFQCSGSFGEQQVPHPRLARAFGMTSHASRRFGMTSHDFHI
jgi:hypothetical protein